MKFQIGDSVREIVGDLRDRKSIGRIAEADTDESSATGEWYFLDFGENGNEYCDGSGYERIIVPATV